MNFQALQQEILQFLWASDPVTATSLGIHTYDNRYARYDRDSLQVSLARKKEFLRSLGDINDQLLSSEEKIDCLLLSSHLSQQIHLADQRQYFHKNPAHYPEEALFGVQQLQINAALPQEHQVIAIIGRLLDMPRMLDEGIDNLSLMAEEIPQEWVEVALDSVKAGRHFLEDIVPQFSGTVPQYFRELLDSNTVALKALHHYEKFLNQLLPRANGSISCGREYFDFVLKEKYMLPYSAEDILAIARESIQHTEKLLAEVGRELNPDLDWVAQINQLKNNHPTPENLLAYYQQEANRVLAFVEKQNLLTLPASETLAIMETPIFEWSIMPYSAYVTPAPFEDHSLGYFWVTPVHHSMSEADQLERLRAHNNYDVILTTVHQAYPGQHIQFVRANEHASPVRKTLHDSIMASGWAFYCEEMVYTEELFTDLNTRLFQLKAQLWREYRAMIDVQLHLGQMSFRDAVETLMDKVKLDYNSAQAEVKRYSLFPTIGMGYLIGKREIINLRQDVAEQEGDQFSLKHFHDRLLSSGIIPVALIRQKMVSQEKPASSGETLPY